MALADMKVALIPLGRPTFDTALASQLVVEMRAQLKRAGFTLLGPETLLSSVDEVEKVADDLASRSPDLLLVFQATFTDGTMVVRLAQTVDAPILLWAIPEERTGGRLRLNSLCGINLAAHALTRAGRRYDYVYAAPDDPAGIEQARAIAGAGYVRRLLRQTRIGRVGEHPAGFDTCRYDPDALKRTFGLEVVPIPLDRVFQAVKMVPLKEKEGVLQALSTKLDGLDRLGLDALLGTLGTYVALRRLVEQEHLDGLAIRCWPEFFTELGCAACGAMSMLSDELRPCSCETDVHGTITQLILQWLSGEPAFGTDLVSVDVKDDAVVLWHCGLAPLSMADPAVRPRGTVHSNRHLPLLMEFPLKPGRVTVARLSEATGSYRLIVGTGEMLRAPISFSGTSGLLRFDRPATEVMATILKEGLEHHISLTYGNHVPALLALARMLDLPVLRL